ncbi:hypothetical protein NMY22_g17701 [Coprinellus aureogranulatus]|nr:hypothetical protein NMY22_g17701 [Coprinellus aureogranulatus]
MAIQKDYPVGFSHALPRSKCSSLMSELQPTTGHSAAGLLSLPVELLVTICTELSLVDILQFRLTCRPLYKTCGTRQVWRRLFLSALGVSIPKPFFLSRPLDGCSAKDLELALRRWGAPWLPATLPQAIRRGVSPKALDGPRFLPWSMALAPGGRWMLMCRHDTSVWYFDLSNDWTSTLPLEPRLLIPALPPPAGTTEWRRKSIVLAVDWTSEEALGSSVETHFLTQFNIAVLVCDRNPDISRRQPMSVKVWRVKVEETPAGPELRLSEMLSAFADVPDYNVVKADLYGQTLAYSTQISSVFVVAWREVNGKARKDLLSCRRIPTGARLSIEVWTLRFLWHLLLSNEQLSDTKAATEQPPSHWL